jgi:ureidoacrylate peracid hydrolase
MQKSAAILIDLQNGFIGGDSPFELTGIPQLIANVETLVAGLRNENIPIVWTRVYLDEWTDSPYSALWPNHFSGGRAAFLARNTKSFDFIPAVRELIQAHDIVIDKPRYSAFLRTDLEVRLRASNVGHLFFAGVTTNVCVESSLRDAFQRDFSCTLVKDCTLTFTPAWQACTEEIVNLVFGRVASLDDCIGRFSQSAR